MGSNVMMHLQSSSPRPPRPFTDWLADVDRLMLRQLGRDAQSVAHPWTAEFNVGASPQEAIDGYRDTMRGSRSTLWL